LTLDAVGKNVDVKLSEKDKEIAYLKQEMAKNGEQAERNGEDDTHYRRKSGSKGYQSTREKIIV
jgi:hypothetical protein